MVIFTLSKCFAKLKLCCFIYLAKLIYVYYLIITIKGSVHNYSTYPTLLHKCSKNVVFLNEICSKYVVN